MSGVTEAAAELGYGEQYAQEAYRRALDIGVPPHVLADAFDKPTPPDAAGWLAQYLREHDGEADAQQLIRDGRKAGLTKQGLRAARETLGVRSIPQQRSHRRTWCAPEAASTRL